MSYIILDNNLMWGRVKRLINKTEAVTELTNTTTSDIAREIVLRDIASKAKSLTDIPQISEITGKTAAYIIKRIALEKCEEGSLSYYSKEVLDDVKTCEEIYRIMKDIRLGETIESDEAAKVLEIPRIKDFTLIKESYLETLRENNYYDPVRFITDAVDILEKDGATGEEVWKLHFNPISYMEKRLEELLGAKEFELTVELEKPEISFYKSYGIENEVRYIVEKIKEENIPFGDVNIFYSSNKYEDYIKAVLGREGIPYSFVTGKTPSDGYITLFKDIIRFASGDKLEQFKYKDYRRIVNSHLMTNVCYGINIQKDNGIGWGIKPYIYKANENIKKITDYTNELKNQLKELKETDTSSFSDEEKATYEKDVEYKQSSIEGNERNLKYYEMMKALLAIFAGEEPKTLLDYYRGICDFLSDYTNKPNLERGKGLNKLKSKVRQISVISTQVGLVNTRKAFEILEQIVDGLVMTDSENAGAVSVSKMGSKYLSDRNNSFFVGLSFGEFTNKVSDSPVISDIELEKLVAAPLGLSRVINKNKEDYTRKTIEGLTGKVYLSYNEYDTSALVEDSPADIYISFINEKGINPNDIDKVTFDDLGDESLVFNRMSYDVERKDILDVETDDKKVVDEGEVKEAGNSNIESLESKTEDKIKEKKDTNVKTRKVYFSASTIQTLLSCFREYRYEKNAYMRGESEVFVDDKEWLAANEKGNFAHEILERYFNEVEDGTGAIPEEFNEELYNEIESETYQKFLESRPCRSLKLSQAKKEEYSEKIKTYLINTHKDFKEQGWKILCKEGKIHFGKMLDEDINAGLINNNKIEIILTGYMDRVDYREKDGTTEYRVVDYKTGKKEKLDKEIEDNILIQHELYLRILEYLAKEKLELIDCNGIPKKIKEGIYKEAEYHLFYEEKEEDRVIPKEKDENLYKNMISRLTEYFNIQDGDEIPRDSKGPYIKYCAYKSICGKDCE